MSGNLSKQELKDIICRFFDQEWPDVNADGLEVRKDGEGYCNRVFVVSREVGVSEAVEPAAVVVKMYGGNDFDCSAHPIKNSPTEEAVIVHCLSEAGLGPKLYGVFLGGRVEEYATGGTLTPADSVADPSIDVEKAKAFARFHSLQLPLVKDKMLKIREKEYCLLPETRKKLVEDVESTAPGLLSKMKSLLEWNITAEKEWLFQVFEESNFRRSFVHSDSNYTNMILRPDGRVTMIDYEFSCYGYSCLDLGGHFVFRQLDARNRTDSLSGFGYADEEKIRSFLEVYVDELEKIGKRQETDTVDNLMLETDYGSLLCCLIFGEMMMAVADPAFIYQKQMISCAYCFYENYTNIKKKLMA